MTLPDADTRPAPIGAVVARAVARLQQAGVDDPRLDARLLAAHALGLSGPGAVMVRAGEPMPPGAASRLDALVARRAAREPVGRILGRRGFWTLDLALGPDTLEPRPDTETVVAAVLERLPDRNAPLSILDLGTGTGAILLALLAERPLWRGLGVDIAPGAVATARANAVTHGLADRAAFRVADWTAGPDAVGAPPGGSDMFDIVVSNPPYVRTGEMAGLAPEVRAHDPPVALDGGADGLHAYRRLVPLAARLLRRGGWLAFEVGVGQADAVSALMRDGVFPEPVGVRDLGGVTRCVIGART